jgi:hypothetical protein
MLRDAWHMSHNKNGEPNSCPDQPFATEIMLIAFLNQGCERASSGFKCHLTADVAECIRWIYAPSWHINGGTNPTYFWDDNTQSSGQQPAEDSQSHEYDSWNLACYIMFRLTPTDNQWLTCVGLCGHVVWCNAKGVGDKRNYGNMLGFSVQKHIRNRHFSSWAKIFVDWCDSSFARVEEFKYLETTPPKQNSIREEIKSRLKSGYTCYHLVQNLLSSSLLSKNLKIKIYTEL